MTNPTILVIEDEPSLGQALQRKLFHENYTVIVAADGQAGLGQAFAQRPGIILLDLMLPGMNGMEILEKLREEKEWGAKVPVIILSNESSSEAIMEGLKQKVQAYFVKADTTLDTILTTIKELLPV